MNKVYENINIIVVVDNANTITIISKNSDTLSNRISVSGSIDGHLEIRGEDVRFHPKEGGFDVWLS